MYHLQIAGKLGRKVDLWIKKLTLVTHNSTFLIKADIISQTTTLFIWFFSAISNNFYSFTENTKSFMYDFRFATRVKWGRKVRQKRERRFLLVFQLLKRELRFVLFYIGFFIFFVSCSIISNGKLSKKVFKTAANYEGNYVFKLQLYSFCLLTNYQKQSKKNATKLSDIPFVNVFFCHLLTYWL